MMSSRDIVPGIGIPVITVRSADDIPDFPLYWVSDQKCFAVRIAGSLVCGNVAEIMPMGAKGTRACRNIGGCVRDDCEYWHPGDIRGFTNTMFTYAPPGYGRPDNRHIGNRSTLMGDAELATEFETFRAQTAHDLLTLIAAETRVIHASRLRNAPA